MDPKVRRIVIVLAVLVVAITIAGVVVLNSRTPGGPGRGGAATAPGAGSGTAAATPPAGQPNGAPAPSESGPAPALPADVPAIAAAPADASGWKAAAPGDAAAAPAIGSLDPRTDRLKLEFTEGSAGIARIAFSDFWETARAKDQARRHWDAVAKGDASPPVMPDESLRYILQTAQKLPTPDGQLIEVPMLATRAIEVDGHTIQLFGRVWSPTAPGAWTTEVRDADGTPKLRIARSFTLTTGSYEVVLAQSVENLSGAPLKVRWIEYGPTDLQLDRSRYIDLRRFHFGYLQPAQRDPSRTVLTDGQMHDRTALLSLIDKGKLESWPTEETTRASLELAWIGSTNRYFALAVHAPTGADAGTQSIAPVVESVRQLAAAPSNFTDQAFRTVFTELHSPVRTIDAGATARFDLGVYAGPLDRKVFAAAPYSVLQLDGLIVYLMSGCCASCTFPWLARLLLSFLSMLHDYVVFDWGVAIIVLVIIVRALLHPLMKRSQIQMQRTTRGMSELKPELERLQERFRDDPQKLQQEQLRLYREKGVNPVGCVTGMVPTFLQMPIWLALYAMLYFAFDLRQQPAFFGVFQLIPGWRFLADLSASDHFFWEFDAPHSVFGTWNVTGINLIPFLMALVFWLQQKYSTPPSMNLSREQEQQQKIMKLVTIVMFPLMLYSAPSGLTLYILTSSLIGIWESRMIRRHIQATDLNPPKPQKKKQDALGRMYEEALERAKSRRSAPPKRFKER